MNTVNKQLTRLAIPVTIFLITIYTVLPFAKAGVPMVSTLNNTTLWWGISFLILLSFYLSKFYFFDKRNKKDMLIVGVFLLWNAICIVRGMLVAEIYWDYKALIVNAMALMLPIVIYSATNTSLVQSVLSFYIKYALPLFIVFAVILRTDAFGFYLVPISSLLLFLPIFNLRQRLFILFVAVFVIVSDFGARSNVIKFGAPMLVLVLYYLRKQLSTKAFETIRLGLFIAPIVFFLLAVSGTFNIFQIQDYLKGDYSAVGTDFYGNRVEQSMMVDTRTFLYEEVLNSAINNDYWLLGRTPARGNDSEAFGKWTFEVTGRYERIENEIGLANVFTWTGIVGVILYMLLFFKASYLAVNKSNNIFAKILGVYIAFRWLYAWVEDVNNFSLNYFMLMIMLGLCFSHRFRRMTNKDVFFWGRGIFDSRYVRFQNYIIKKRKYERSEIRRTTNMS